MWPISTHLISSIGAAALHARVAGGHLPQIEILGLEIFVGSDMPQVIIVFVRSRDHVAAALQSLIRDHAHVLHAHRTERSGIGAEQLPDFLRMRRPEFGGLHRGAEFRFAERMIAAHQRENGLAVGDQHQALHLRGLGEPRERRKLGRWSFGRAYGTASGVKSPSGSASGGAVGRAAAFSRFAA